MCIYYPDSYLDALSSRFRLRLLVPGRLGFWTAKSHTAKYRQGDITSVGSTTGSRKNVNKAFEEYTKWEFFYLQCYQQKGCFGWLVTPAPLLHGGMSSTHVGVWNAHVLRRPTAAPFRWVYFLISPTQTIHVGSKILNHFRSGRGVWWHGLAAFRSHFSTLVGLPPPLFPFSYITYINGAEQRSKDPVKWSPRMEGPKTPRLLGSMIVVVWIVLVGKIHMASSLSGGGGPGMVILPQSIVLDNDTISFLLLLLFQWLGLSKLGLLWSRGIC